MTIGSISAIVTLGYGSFGSVGACTLLGFEPGAAVVTDQVGWSGRPGANQRRGKGRKPAPHAPAQMQLVAANDLAAQNEDFKFWKDVNDKRRQDAAARKVKAAEQLKVERQLQIPQQVVAQPVVVEAKKPIARKAPTTIKPPAIKKAPTAPPALAAPAPIPAPAAPPPPPALDLTQFVGLDPVVAGALTALAAHFAATVAHHEQARQDTERRAAEETARQRKIMQEREQWQRRIDTLISNAKVVGTRSRASAQRSASRH